MVQLSTYSLHSPATDDLSKGFLGFSLGFEGAKVWGVKIGSPWNKDTITLAFDPSTWEVHDQA